MVYQEDFPATHEARDRKRGNGQDNQPTRQQLPFTFPEPRHPFKEPYPGFAMNVPDIVLNRPVYESHSDRCKQTSKYRPEPECLACEKIAVRSQRRPLIGQGPKF